jgi:hypothetical protein
MPSAPAQNWRVLLRSRRRIVGARVNARMSVLDSAADSDASVSTVSVVRARCARVGMTWSCKNSMLNTEKQDRREEGRTRRGNLTQAYTFRRRASYNSAVARRSQLAATNGPSSAADMHAVAEQQMVS